MSLPRYDHGWIVADGPGPGLVFVPHAYCSNKFLYCNHSHWVGTKHKGGIRSSQQPTRLSSGWMVDWAFDLRHPVRQRFRRQPSIKIEGLVLTV